MEEEDTQSEDLKKETKATEEVVVEPEKIFQEDLSKLPMDDEDGKSASLLNSQTLELLFDLDLPISVELARKDLQLQEIVNLGEGSIVEFDKIADENVDILVNNKKIAEGEVVVIDDRFGVRIINLVNPADRIKGITQLNS